MPSIKEVRDRIGSVSSMDKITNAMYLISSTKKKKAKANLDQARPFFEMNEREIKRVFQSRQDVNSRYFYPKTGRKPAETYAYLVITADRGLAGAYNHNVIKRAQKEMKKHKKTRLYVVGEYGRRYFLRHKMPIERTFFYTAKDPSFRKAREICSQLLEEYDNGRVDEIRVIYSDMASELNTVVRMDRILPFERTKFLTPRADKNAKDVQYEFYPSVTEVIDRMMPAYIAGYVFGALVDSFCAEQNARMNAMSAASRNAKELIGRLTLQYNMLRQSEITQEITEISAGARAQKKKREKEEAAERQKAAEE